MKPWRGESKRKKGGKQGGKTRSNVIQWCCPGHHFSVSSQQLGLQLWKQGGHEGFLRRPAVFVSNTMEVSKSSSYFQTEGKIAIQNIFWNPFVVPSCLNPNQVRDSPGVILWGGYPPPLRAHIIWLFLEAISPDSSCFGPSGTFFLLPAYSFLSRGLKVSRVTVRP